MYFSSNIKLLRKRLGRTQDDIAFSLNMKRPTLSGYENGIAEPGMEALIAFSRYFKISIDTLVKEDLSKLAESELSQLERGYDVFITGGKLRVLATTVNADNEENVEMVAETAKAGYRSGFADPEFIRVLPVFQLPFLSRDRKYRAFQINGDSMLPIPDKSWVIAEFVQNWFTIRNGYPYIILTMEDGIVFKVAENKLKAEQKLTLVSLNPLYEPYDVHVKDIREVWKFVHYVSSQIPEPNQLKENLASTVMTMQKELKEIQMKLKL
ncbi:MAG: helix-turn-helix domain-containing protein [Bacteroidales bacterium]|jgi:transcriptional regulator with XRE-family HTH domain|nr:helix-turn-helix domain-containing protein [Bacteroidales bacterium]MDX9905794.1 helix-turn-helix domain-containing protein [Bacteroidales bacterium]